MAENLKRLRNRVVPIIRDSYFKMIENSLGIRLFRNFYAYVDGKKKDITKNGQLSCAFFVSSILNNFELIEHGHLTVESTIKDMRKTGWKEIKKIRKGAVLVWEEKKNKRNNVNKHLGFYIGNGQAISNDSIKRVPIRHQFTYGSPRDKSYRRIIAVFWHPRLSK